MLTYLRNLVFPAFEIFQNENDLHRFCTIVTHKSYVTACSSSRPSPVNSKTKTRVEPWCPYRLGNWHVIVQVVIVHVVIVHVVIVQVVMIQVVIIQAVIVHAVIVRAVIV